MSEPSLPTVDDVARAGFCSATGLNISAATWAAEPEYSEAKAAWTRVAAAVLALFPGRTEAVVKAEALRDYAADLRAQGFLALAMDAIEYANRIESEAGQR